MSKVKLLISVGEKKLSKIIEQLEFMKSYAYAGQEEDTLDYIIKALQNGTVITGEQETDKISLLPMVYNTLDEASRGGYDKGYAMGLLKGRALITDDCISRSALKEAIDKDAEDIGGIEDVIDYIDNALTVEPICPYLSDNEVKQPCLNSPCERPQGKWGKWVISEIQCPNCLEYFQTDCYSMEELKKCPVCGEDMKGGAE